MAKGDNTARNVARNPNPSAAIQPVLPYFIPTEIGVDHYIFKSNLGHGSYGDVISAYDERKNEEVAIKKVRLDSRLHPRLCLIRTLREIRVLSRLQHDGVITMSDIYRSASNGTSDAIYIIQPVMTTDLAQQLECDSKAADAQKLLKAEDKQWILYQILRAVKYIHSANISHRDLKPSNVLINPDSFEIKICDLNLARVMGVSTQDSSNTGGLTLEVQTLWYRAPEVLYQSTHYGRAVDVWSIGCILAELLNGKVLFCGQNHFNQIWTILSILGNPSVEEAQYFTSKGATIFVQQINGEPVRRAALWPGLFPNAVSDAHDLLDRMLKFGPNTRITVNEALSHPYVASCRKPCSEIECNLPFDQELDIGNLTEDDLRKLLYQWIDRYRAKHLNWDSIELQDQTRRDHHDKNCLDDQKHDNAKNIEPTNSANIGADIKRKRECSEVTAGNCEKKARFDN